MASHSICSKIRALERMHVWRELVKVSVFVISWNMTSEETSGATGFNELIHHRTLHDTAVTSQMTPILHMFVGGTVIYFCVSWHCYITLIRWLPANVYTQSWIQMFTLIICVCWNLLSVNTLTSHLSIWQTLLSDVTYCSLFVFQYSW